MALSVQRILVVSGVAAAHVAVLLIEISSPPTKNTDDVLTTLIFIPLTNQRTYPAEGRSATRTIKGAVAPTAAEGEAAPIHIETTPSPDKWYEGAKASIDAAIARQQREDTYRRFELKPPEPPPPLYEDIGKGIFDRGPAHEITGPIDMGEGMFKTWIDPYCYVVSGMGPGGRIDTTVCAEPGANVNKQDMFAQFRPKYLKRLPID